MLYDIHNEKISYLGDEIIDNLPASETWIDGIVHIVEAIKVLEKDKRNCEEKGTKIENHEEILLLLDVIEYILYNRSDII